MKFPARVLSTLLVFAIGIATSLLFQWFVPPQFYDVGENDFMNRDLPVARLLATGQEPVFGDTVYPIGFPLVIAGVLKLAEWTGIAVDQAMLFLQVMCMGISTVLVFWMAQLLWQASLAWLAVLGWSTYPFVLWLTGQASTELLFVVFLFGGLWLAATSLLKHVKTWVGFFGAGILFGCAMLVRPAAFAIPFLLATLWLIRPSTSLLMRAQVILLLLLGTLIVVAPWELYVWNKTGRWVLISTGDLPSIRDGLTFGVRAKSYREGIALPDPVRTLMLNAETQRAQLQSLADIVGFLGAESQSNPTGMFQFILLKAARSWYGTDSMRYENLILPLQLFYLVCGGLGLILALRMSRPSRELALGALAVILYFWLITILVLPILRYMIPAMGLMFVFVPGIAQWYISHPRRTELERIG